MSLLSKEDIDNVMQAKLRSNNYELIAWEKREITGIPIGFLSAPQKVCVTFKRNGKIEKLHLFIKGLPPSSFHQNAILSCGAFKKEADVYELFLNHLKEKVNGDPIPGCFLTRHNDIIVLEDLSHKGFCNVPLTKPLDLNHCIKVVESLVKVHAESITFEIKNNRKLNQHIPVLNNETLLAKDANNFGRKSYYVGVEASKVLADKYLSQYSADLSDKVFKYLNKLLELIVPSTKYPNVLSHSDLWANNIMFRYNNKGEVVEASLVDFQLAGYRPITFDFQLFIHLCTDKDLRANHYNTLCKHYYNYLSECLSLENIELSSILTWNDFINAFNETLPIILSITPLWLHFVLIPEHIIREVLGDDKKWQYYYEVNRDKYVLRAAEECVEYKERLVQSLVDLFEYFTTA